jgi:hypothetical protein
MDRTVRAALFAAFIAFAAIAGFGVFLAFDVAASLLVGAVTGVLAGLLLWGASRRADTFHPTDPGAHLRSVQPGFPGEPEPAEPPDERAGPGGAPDQSDVTDDPTDGDDDRG